MAIDNAYATGSAVTISNTEMSLGVTGGTTSGVPVARTDAGVYQLVLDMNNMAKGDEYRVKIYEKARSGGTARVVFQTTFMGVQAELFMSPPLQLGVGWDMTCIRVAGSDRAFDWSVRRLY